MLNLDIALTSANRNINTKNIIKSNSKANSHMRKNIRIY